MLERQAQAVYDTDRFLQDKEWYEGRDLGEGSTERENVASQGSKPIQELKQGRDTNRD